MRLYRFMNAENGLRSIRERRLRIGRIEELNDDFEFIGVALQDKAERIALREMRRHLSDKNGVLCMTKSWSSPLMWAHYADSHRGMALGFDVPDQAFYSVEYTAKRPKLSDFGHLTLDDITPEDIKRLTKMKAMGWSYEQEYRAYIALENATIINGSVHYFMPFSHNLNLREVIVGSRYTGRRSDVLAVVDDPTVDTYMSRGSFEDFVVVRQREDSMWP
ncbi:hypothetical protein BTHI11S_04919 [Bosea thiooxidans]|uniref:DUF2971 domain-containing protein n=1 Tax=Bosea thiooxidans TaxID=53254 RepID=A0A1T5GQS1_9HYPH|nr:DUF2971 domain-containing protein [Bosea thiooxidans]SKC10719.1 Protein of unknown function [Bosea thiooxidans]